MCHNLGNHLKGREEMKSVSEPCPSYQPPSPFPKIPVSVSVSLSSPCPNLEFIMVMFSFQKAFHSERCVLLTVRLYFCLPSNLFF